MGRIEAGRRNRAGPEQDTLRSRRAQTVALASRAGGVDRRRLSRARGRCEIGITGGTSELPGIDEELARLIGVAVRIGDPLSRVKRGKKLGENGQIGSYAVAIGLAIE